MPKCFTWFRRQSNSTNKQPLSFQGVWQIIPAMEETEVARPPDPQWTKRKYCEQFIAAYIERKVDLGFGPAHFARGEKWSGKDFHVWKKNPLLFLLSLVFWYSQLAFLWSNEGQVCQHFVTCGLTVTYPCLNSLVFCMQTNCEPFFMCGSLNRFSLYMIKGAQLTVYIDNSAPAIGSKTPPLPCTAQADWHSKWPFDLIRNSKPVQRSLNLTWICLSVIEHLYTWQDSDKLNCPGGRVSAAFDSLYVASNELMNAIQRLKCTFVPFGVGWEYFACMALAERAGNTRPRILFAAKNLFTLWSHARLRSLNVNCFEYSPDLVSIVDWIYLIDYWHQQQNPGLHAFIPSSSHFAARKKRFLKIPVQISCVLFWQVHILFSQNTDFW